MPSDIERKRSSRYQARSSFSQRVFSEHHGERAHGKAVFVLDPDGDVRTPRAEALRLGDFESDGQFVAGVPQLATRLCEGALFCCSRGQQASDARRLQACSNLRCSNERHLFAMSMYSAPGTEAASLRLSCGREHAQCCGQSAGIDSAWAPPPLRRESPPRCGRCADRRYANSAARRSQSHDGSSRWWQPRGPGYSVPQQVRCSLHRNADRLR